MLISITACSGDMKSTLGMRKDAPDEFVVISNPPLREPPVFNLVQPTSYEIPDGVQEQGIMVESSSSNLTADDKSFLETLGSSQQSSPKHLVDKEYNARKAEHESKGGIRKTLGKLRGENEEYVIDPVSERNRIKENIDSDRPIHEGEVKHKSSSTLERLWKG